MNRKKCLKIAFVSPKRYSFYPGDYYDRGLGGSESALVLMSAALATLGHKVDVYNCCFKPGIYNRVHWKQLWMFDGANSGYDAVISLRLLETFSQNILAPIRGVWIHDESLPGATEYDKKGRVNLWISVSKTQKDFILQSEKIPESHWFVSRNGLDQSIYNDNLLKVKKNPWQVIYCSAPDRGLLHLLKVWPKIIKKLPKLKLVITGSWALWGNADEENYRFFQEMYDLASKHSSIKMLGRVKKEELAILQRQSRVLLYPVTFNEMFCIVALECLYVGTPIISSPLAAMSERIVDGETGFFIEGKPGNGSYDKQFVNKVEELFVNKGLYNRMSIEANLRTKNSYFSDIALEWQEKFYSLLKRRGRN